MLWHFILFATANFFINSKIKSLGIMRFLQQCFATLGCLPTPSLPLAKQSFGLEYILELYVISFENYLVEKYLTENHANTFLCQRLQTLRECWPISQNMLQTSKFIFRCKSVYSLIQKYTLFTLSLSLISIFHFWRISRLRLPSSPFPEKSCL